MIIKNHTLRSKQYDYTLYPAIVMPVFMSSLIFVTVRCYFEWKRVFSLFVYICFAVGGPIIKRGSIGISLTGLIIIAAAIFWRLSPVRTWISIGTFLGLFCVHWFEVRIGVRFVDIGEIVDYPYLNLLFTTSVKFVPCFKHLVWCCPVITKRNEWINLAPYINIPILHKYIFIC